MLKGGEFEVKDKILAFSMLVIGPMVFGSIPTIMGATIMCTGLFFKRGNPKIFLTALVVCLISGIVSLATWTIAVDYYWGSFGGSEVILFEKAKYRSSSGAFVWDLDFYLITAERMATLLGVPIICGVIVCFERMYSEIRGMEVDSEHWGFGVVAISGPFLVVQLQQMVMFPQSIWQHDYLNVLWLLIPGALGISVLISKLEWKKILGILLLTTTIASVEFSTMLEDEWREYSPHHHEVQIWMWENIGESDVVLISGDLYEGEHYTGFLAGSDVLTRPVNDTSEYTGQWLESEGVDIIIINLESTDYWPIADRLVPDEGWCESMSSEHVLGSYVAFVQC